MAALLACHWEEKREKGLTGESEWRWVSQSPRGRFLDLIHDFDKIVMKRAEGVDHEGREQCAEGLCVGVVLEVLGSTSPLNGLARATGCAEVRGGESVDARHVDGHDFPREDELSVGDA